MRISKYVLIVLLFSIHFMHSQSLKEYRWENRLIVLVNEKGENEEFQNQLESLTAKDIELQDRDLVLLLLNKDSVLFSDKSDSEIDGAQLRKELKIGPNSKGVILIGKDGGVKMREEFHVEPEKIFELIDSMPMRQAEMKN